MEKIIRELVARRSEMERTVFFSPPSDWAAFQKRLGQYIELEALIDVINTSLKGMEKDE